MSEFAYTLEKYNGPKTRYNCPDCGMKHQFARYVDGQGNYIADHVGRCNRESKCGYHMKPKEYFQNNPQPARDTQPEPTKPIQYISSDVLKRTLQAYECNTFVKYLHTIFDNETVQGLIDAYGLGTTKDGSCIFWQVDNVGRVRTGKVIRYRDDGHREKSQPPYFIHTKLKVEPIEQCLFGLHLTMVNDSPIGLVESEKTAVIMAGSFPDYTWLATGGKTNLSKVHVLKGKKVLAFPDTDAFNEWTERLTPYGFRISRALQQHVDDPDRGYDLADFIQPQRILGELIKQGQERGEIKTPQSTLRHGPVLPDSENGKTLPDLGISHNKSAAFQAIAGIPEETCKEPYLETLKDGREILMHPAGYPMSWAQEPKTELQRLTNKYPMVNELINRLELVTIQPYGYTHTV